MVRLVEVDLEPGKRPLPLSNTSRWARLRWASTSTGSHRGGGTGVTAVRGTQVVKRYDGGRPARTQTLYFCYALSSDNDRSTKGQGLSILYSH